MKIDPNLTGGKMVLSSFALFWLAVGLKILFPVFWLDVQVL